ncbi:MAG: DUF2061 domain-containing protein [Brumimicrobium sp.]|nr:DUF2061 domain-containing protein [Brumimicrobium sp.]
MILDQIFISRKERSSDLGTSDRPVRSLVKALSWRTVGTIDTIFISWMLSGELTLAFSIGSIELFTKMVLYFLHERIWNQVRWGK